MFNKMLEAGIISASILISGIVAAAPIEFVPTTDSTGKVWSTNANDGWDNRRGVGFNVDSQQTISSVGAYLDLTNIDLHYGVYEISSAQDVFARTRLLAAGGSTVSTAGLAWIDYGFDGVTLNPGANYLIEFWFGGAANQNFYFNNANVTWSQGAYTSIDGTSGDAFFNSLTADFRINAIEPAANVPEPASAALLGLGMIGMGVLRRKQKA